MNFIKYYGKEYGEFANELIEEYKKQDNILHQNRNSLLTDVDSDLLGIYEVLEEKCIYGEYMSDTVDELISYIEEEVEAKIDNGDCFEYIYRKATEEAEDKDDDISVYVAFSNLLNDAFGQERETVNVWHIEQNMLNDKKAIKELCYSDYIEYDARLDKKCDINKIKKENN